MRERQYRIWDKELKEFVAPIFYFIQWDGSIWFNKAGNAIGRDDLTDQSEKLEATDYTGLNDKNDKPVFEGDIVTKLVLNRFTSEGKLNRESCMEYIQTGVVEYMQDTCQYMLSRAAIYGGKADSFNNSIRLEPTRGQDEFEVIGNVYQNKELLK